MKIEKEMNVNLIPLLEGSVIEATVFDGGHSQVLVRNSVCSSVKNLCV